MINRRNPKIFLGLTEIAGYYCNLKHGFDELGIEATFITLTEHPFKYEDEKVNNYIKLLRYVGNKRTSAKQSDLILATFWSIIRLLLKMILFLWAIMKFDIFIFGHGTSFCRCYELPVIKALGKKILYVMHGSDSRPIYINGAKVANGIDITPDFCISLTHQQKRILSKIERYADVIVSNALSSHFLEKPFVNSLQVGIPFKLTYKHNMREAPTKQQSIKILHSPSNPIVKGTPVIRKTITTLKAKGYPIDYIEIKNKPNSEVLAELEKCDFVIDQLYSDTPLAGFATEAAFFGKPAVVGGYGWKEIEKLLPAYQIPPSQRCHPHNLEEAIEQLIKDKDYCLDLGKKARNFVEENWTSKKVAERFFQLIQGNIPHEWLCDPHDICYLHGVGLSEEEVRRVVRKVIETGGKKALQLSDKPELERLFTEFASLKTNHIQAISKK